MERGEVREWIEEHIRLPEYVQNNDKIVSDCMSNIGVTNKKRVQSIVCKVRQKFGLPIKNVIKPQAHTDIPTNRIVSLRELKAQYDVPKLIAEGIENLPQAEDGGPGLMVESDFISFLYKRSKGIISKDKLRRGLRLPQFENNHTKPNNIMYWGSSKSISELNEKLDEWR